MFTNTEKQAATVTARFHSWLKNNYDLNPKMLVLTAWGAGRCPRNPSHFKQMATVRQKALFKKKLKRQARKRHKEGKLMHDFKRCVFKAAFH